MCTEQLPKGEGKWFVHSHWRTQVFLCTTSMDNYKKYCTTCSHEWTAIYLGLLDIINFYILLMVSSRPPHSPIKRRCNGKLHLLPFGAGGHRTGQAIICSRTFVTVQICMFTIEVRDAWWNEGTEGLHRCTVTVYVSKRPKGKYTRKHEVKLTPGCCIITDLTLWLQ